MINVEAFQGKLVHVGHFECSSQNGALPAGTLLSRQETVEYCQLLGDIRMCDLPSERLRIRQKGRNGCGVVVSQLRGINAQLIHLLTHFIQLRQFLQDVL
ncbi:hypothetical protein D9M70_604280 [compost metagenome]